MTADRRSVSEQPPCKVCEGWGAYCDDHRPPVSGEPRTARQRYLQALMDEHDAYDWEQSGELDSWLKLADDIEAEARLSMHVHHWGDDGKCMYPRCDFVAGASTGAALDVRGVIQHALDDLNAVSDKMMYGFDGDRGESDLLKAHATLVTLLARLAEQEGDR